MKFSHSSLLLEATKKAQKSNKVYKEGFATSVETFNINADIIVEDNTTFAAAQKYQQYGRVAVLNFANPEKPGNGVEKGGIAQEQCLCRSSNLYLCLTDHSIFEDFYGYHRKLKSYFYSDRLIYTQDVTVFKDDNFFPILLHEQEWFCVDIISCAAPVFNKIEIVDIGILKSVYKRRLKNIFEAAIDNNADVIILGAFGCGSFGNPPALVARAFKEVIEENEYRHYFKKIVFAIKKTKASNCPNFVAFEETFGEMPEKERVVLPSGKILRTHNQVERFWEIQKSNPYYGKRFSILGDSISILAGYDTWWGKVIQFFGGELLVNNSLAESCVTKLSRRAEIFPSGCSDERTSNLNVDHLEPDVIVVFLGINDWILGVAREVYQLNNKKTSSLESFRIAYGTMLRKLKENYPYSEVWCCTLAKATILKQQNYVFPDARGGVHIKVYNEIIKEVATLYNCKIIDLFQYDMPYDSLDGIHPSVMGMNTLATICIREMDDKLHDYKRLGSFLDCECDKHYFEEVVDESFGRCYICKKCGKKEYRHE